MPSIEQIIRNWNANEKSLIDPIDNNVVVLSRAKQSDTWHGNLYGKPVRKLCIYLRSSGCEYALNTGGCTMCSHSLLGTTKGGAISSNLLVTQFKTEFNKYYNKIFPILSVFNEGSFLNTNELPFDAMSEILFIIGNSKHVKRLILESRPEYISDDYINFIRKNIGFEIELEIGIGIEALDDFIRNVIINKGISIEDFEKSVKICKRHNVRVLSYILLKPIFLDELQGINCAVETGKYAFSIGCDAVSIEPNGVYPNTIANRLFDLGLFKPPWLWSLMECAKVLSKYGEVRLGGQQFAPLPKTLSSNCSQCTEKIWTYASKYNSSYDIKYLEGFCRNCYEYWRNELSHNEHNFVIERLSERIERYFDMFKENEN
jgi:radical SAM enzyme (TIGR01210 family)